VHLLLGSTIANYVIFLLFSATVQAAPYTMRLEFSAAFSRKILVFQSSFPEMLQLSRKHTRHFGAISTLGPGRWRSS
jgi:hypothetical protein